VDAAGATVAVKVTLWPVVDGFALEAIDVVVVARTLKVKLADWLM
jgi:hypothetical protein